MRSASTALLICLGLLGAAPAWAQSVGYVTGIPGKDPAGDDEIGWGPAYRPETSFAQPGTPPTPGERAGAAYRARTGHGVYDRVEGERAARPPRTAARRAGRRPREGAFEAGPSGRSRS